MSNIFPPALVRRLKEEFSFEEAPHFDPEEQNKEKKSALIIVDLQHDFLPGGSLAVTDGDKIISVINSLQSKFDLVIASQDWHPDDHMSFASNHDGKKPMDIIELNSAEQVLWPDHCVQGTRGAELSPDLDKNRIELIVRKGTNKQIDSYSAFFDNDHKKSTGLAGYLIEKGISKITLCGLAADFCVYFTAMDALNLGFEVEIAMHGTKPIDPAAFNEKIEIFKKNGGFVV